MYTEDVYTDNILWMFLIAECCSSSIVKNCIYKLILIIILVEISTVLNGKF
jgi:hypothetical protein